MLKEHQGGVRVSVRRIMSTPVVTLSPEDSVARARRLFRTHEISALPVVSDAMTLRGILLARDLVASQPDEARTPASTVMRRRVHTLAGDAPIGDLAAVMAHHRIHHLVIVSKRLVEGIVSSFDLLKILGITLQGSLDECEPITEESRLPEVPDLILLDTAPESPDEWT